MHYPNVLYVIVLLLTAKYIIHLHNEDARIEEDNEKTITADENTDDERYYGDSESEYSDSPYRRKRRRTISLHDRLRIHELMNQ
jgi:hypothetical protein